MLPENPADLLAGAREQRVGDRRLWDLSLKYIAGRQRQSDDVAGAAIERRDLFGNSGKYEVSDNQILPIYRAMVSRLETVFPACVVVPAGPTSSEDIAKAILSEEALRYYWQAARLERVYSKLVEWLCATGTVAALTYYDPADENVLTRGYGAYDIFFPKGCLDPDEAEWVALRTRHDREGLIKAYEPKSLTGKPQGWRKSIEGAGQSQHTDDGRAGHQHRRPTDEVEAFEFWFRDGRHGVMVGGDWVWREDEYPVKVFPVEIARYTVIPNRLYGLSLVAPLLEPQSIYNTLRAQILENAHKMGNPKWMVPTTSHVNTQSLTSGVAEVVDYSPVGGPPTQSMPSPLPSYVAESLVQTQANMQDRAGLHSVSMGKRAVGVYSGAAIDALQGGDNSQLGMTMREMERMAEGIGKAALMTMRTYYDENRWMAMRDENGRIIHKALQATAIFKVPEIFIETGTLFRTGAADMERRAIELAQMQLIDPREARDAIDFRTLRARKVERAEGLEQARADLAEITTPDEMGRFPGIELFLTDDLEAYEKVFKEYMRSEAYHELPPEQQQRIRDIYVAIATAGMGVGAFQAARQQQQVWPQSQGTPPNQNGLQTKDYLRMVNGPEGQEPGTGSAAEAQTTSGAEAMISPTGGGTGL